MRKVWIPLIVLLACGEDASKLTVEDERSLKYAVSLLLSNVSNYVLDPGSPMFNRLSSFSWKNVSLSYCTGRSNPSASDNDMDGVRSNDTIIFDCPDTIVAVNIGSQTFNVRYSISGTLIHEDENDNDPYSFEVKWKGPFRYSVSIQDTFGNVLHASSFEGEGSLLAYDVDSLRMRMEIFNATTSGGTYTEAHLVMDVFKFPGWFPGMPIDSLSYIMDANAYVHTQTGNLFFVDMLPESEIVAHAICGNGFDKHLNVKEASIVLQIYTPSHEHLKDLPMNYSNCLLAQ